MIIHSFKQTCLVVKMLHYFSWEMENIPKKTGKSDVFFVVVQTLQSNLFVFFFCESRSHIPSRKTTKKMLNECQFVPDMFHLHWQMKREKRTGCQRPWNLNLPWYHYHSHFHHFSPPSSLPTQSSEPPPPPPYTPWRPPWTNTFFHFSFSHFCEWNL